MSVSLKKVFPRMGPTRFFLGATAITSVVYLLMLALNEWLFTQSEFIRGVNWVYLPAGIRLLSTLLFGAAGALGIFIASLLASSFYYFPGDSISSIAGAVSSAMAPYIIYRFAVYRFNFQGGSLANLTSRRLLICCAGYALANVLLHHAWFLPLSRFPYPWQSMGVMFFGDMAGSLLVLYTIKLVLSVVAPRRVA
jgi:hypothetical protein